MLPVSGRIFNGRTILLLALLVPMVFVSPSPRVQGANNQDVYLYLHRLPANVSISGFQTREIMNATSLWGGAQSTPNLRYTVFNFTLYPQLASNLQSVGVGSLDLWVTVNGAPGTLNATLYEQNIRGETALVSRFANVTDSTDPNTPYRVTVSFNINHTFTSSSTIKLSLTSTRVSQLQLYYDSQSYPSGMRLPVSSVPQVTLIESYDSALARQTSFSLNWTESQRVVFVTIRVADPFGAYHVANATFSLTNPDSMLVDSGLASPFTSTPGSPGRLFGFTWSYDGNSIPGNYTISVTAYDLSNNFASGLGQFNMYYVGSTPPPGSQPPGGPDAYSWLFLPLLVVIAGAGLLGFLAYNRSRHAKCAKCAASFNRKLTRCPTCGTEITHS